MDQNGVEGKEWMGVVRHSDEHPFGWARWDRDDEVMRLEVEREEMSDEEREMRDEREREEKEVQLFGCASTRC